MKQMCSVTIVITLYNRLDCINAAICSALLEFPSQPIIIVDDASTDSATEFIGQRFQREIDVGTITVVRLFVNVGVTGAKNIGFNLAKTEWVLFLDSDDVFVTDSGRDMLMELTLNKTNPIVFFRCIDSEGKFVGMHQNKSGAINLEMYLRFSSFGEALTAVNKKLITSARVALPYVAELRGYEGLGCMRLIRDFGPAHLSAVIGRIYDCTRDDRLSVSRGFLQRVQLIARGHLTVVKEFGYAMSYSQRLLLLLKAALYFMVAAVQASLQNEK